MASHKGTDERGETTCVALELVSSASLVVSTTKTNSEIRWLFQQMSTPEYFAPQPLNRLCELTIQSPFVGSVIPQLDWRLEMNNIEAAQRLIKAATGETYGDGLVVTDFGVGIAEPGYGDSKTPWALGNWNTKRFMRKGEPPLTNEESLPSRLFDALERIGVEGHWHDEWIKCDECQCIVRNEPDSYGWLPYYFEATESSDIRCLNCIPDDAAEFNDVLSEFDYIDNPYKAVMESISASRLIEAGWEKHNGTYASGWQPGQDDKPRKVYDAIKNETSGVEVLFRVSNKSQFDMNFEAWTRPEPRDDDTAPEWAIEMGEAIDKC